MRGYSTTYRHTSYQSHNLQHLPILLQIHIPRQYLLNQSPKAGCEHISSTLTLIFYSVTMLSLMGDHVRRFWLLMLQQEQKVFILISACNLASSIPARLFPIKVWMRHTTSSYTILIIKDNSPTFFLRRMELCCTVKIQQSFHMTILSKCLSGILEPTSFHQLPILQPNPRGLPTHRVCTDGPRLRDHPRNFAFFSFHSSFILHITFNVKRSLECSL